jgi:hypothetical protein
MVWLAMLGAGAGAATSDPSPSAPSAAADTLAQVDQAFRSAYELAVRESIATAPPTLLVLGGKIVLYRNGNRSELPLLSPLFDELKTVAHVPLSLFAILQPGDAPFDTAHLAELASFRAQIAGARGALDAAPLSAAQRDRQEQMLTAALAIADEALGAKTVSRARLTKFCRKMAPLALANVAEAVAIYLEELNRRVARLLPEVPVGERGRMLVIVSGVHQARIDNAAVQYFERLLGNPPLIAQRVIYAENVSDEAGALHLLGIHQVAFRVGDAFFADPTFMNTDLFGHAAQKIVPVLKLPPSGR